MGDDEVFWNGYVFKVGAYYRFDKSDVLMFAGEDSDGDFAFEKVNTGNLTYFADFHTFDKVEKIDFFEIKPALVCEQHKWYRFSDVLGVEVISCFCEMHGGKYIDMNGNEWSYAEQVNVKEIEWG